MDSIRIYIFALGLISYIHALDLGYYKNIRFSREANDCQMPSNPPHGVYMIVGDHKGVLKAGDYAPNYSQLSLNCGARYQPLTKDGPYCINGIWNSKPSTCTRTCPTLTSSVSTKITCSFEGHELPTCDNPIEGTIATLTCAAYYEEPSIEQYPSRICQNDGEWWNGIPKCYPICGEKRSKGRTNIVNGKNSTFGDHPWHVGIYNASKYYLCGGSIISKQVVVTAAHCVTDEDDGTPYSEKDYLIAAGKYYRSYDDPRDQYPQYSPVELIDVTTKYKGNTLNHEADIAVIVLAKALTFSRTVQPICVDWNSRYELEQLFPNNNGIVSGWGYTTESGDLSDELKEIEIPYLSSDHCFQSFPKTFRKFVRQDKVCGGYLGKGIAVCGGDSGGALAFQRQATGRYYIRGIVSVSPSTDEGNCDSNQYGLYTLVSKHLVFLNQYLYPVNKVSVSSSSSAPVLETRVLESSTTIKSVSKPSSNRCQIPEDPPNGEYVISNKFQYRDYVTSNTTLSTKCSTNYQVGGNELQVSVCRDGVWVPKPSSCYRVCEKLTSPVGTKISCSLNDVALESCDSPVEGTIAVISCEPFYEQRDTLKSTFSVCRDGSWSHLLAQCYPTCGSRVLRDETSLKRHPWHIGIYRDHEFMCNGVIINHRIVLSVSSCFTKRDGSSTFSKGTYHVAAGKYYKTYDDPRDKYAQYSLIDDVIHHYPEKYEGEITYYAYDIAVLILEQPMQLSIAIQPPCMDFDNKYKRQRFSSTSTGIATGWGFRQEPHQSPDELIDTDLSYLAPRDCDLQLPSIFKRYRTFDKFCAVDSYNESGSGTCEVTVGTPLVFLQPEENRYYLKGLASVSPSKEHAKCGSNPIIFVMVPKYLRFIQNIINLNKV